MRTLGRIACGAVCVLVGGGAAGGAEAVVPEPGVPRVTLPLMKTAPAIDGVIHEEEWAGAVRNVGFSTHHEGTVDFRDAVFWLGADRANVYVALKTATAPGNDLLVRAVPDPDRDIREAFADDSFELALDPRRGRQAGDRTYYHIISNARGALYDRAIDPDNRQNPMTVAWRIAGWAFESTVTNDQWQVEIAVPLASLGAAPEDLERPWGVRICRNWKRPYAQSQWETKGVSYLDQPSMPVVAWDDRAPVVQVLSLHKDWQQPEIAVAVRNPHGDPLEVKVALSDAWHFNPPQEMTETRTVAPGRTETFTLQAPDNGPAGLHRTVIAVSSADDSRTYYFRDYRWSMHPPATLWAVGEEAKAAVTLLFKYYPYHDRVRLRVDAGGLTLTGQVERAVARISRQPAADEAAGTPLWEETLPLAEQAVEGIYAVPALGDGRYLLSVALEGTADVPAAPVTQPFVRQVFEWEHNTLGLSDKVMPPFTPLQAESNVVRSVLREHVHGPDGLWTAVTSQGRSLLTRPLSWEVVSATTPGGPAARQAVAGRGWTVLAGKPVSVAANAAWTAGPLQARVRVHYDYDGLMLTTLRLEPTEGREVRQLTLNIPVAAGEARYMHAVGDGLRHNFAGFVPPGEGRVWDSSQGNKIEIANTFFPYLWVGGGERGICWFADNDRDWVLDSETPVIELVREGDTLLMRVHFITRPGPLKRLHEIVFGLQATPTKPMPEGWRRWMGRRVIPGGRAVSWMGSTYYWGGINHNVYPYEQNFEYFAELAASRATGQVNAEFKTRWLENIAKTWPPDTPRYEFLKRHLDAGFHTASNSTRDKDIRLFGYTNARGIGFDTVEFATFQDEWLRYAWFNRNWDWTGGVAYDVSPSESFVDFAVWYYKRMLDWADGVYWDNTFLSAHYDPVVGNAWIDEDGKVHPGLGLFHLRNLIKRTAIMHWQASRGMAPNRLPLVQLSHMTNTQLVPVLSFGNCNMDWEWKYGYTDFQDRFSPDLTVAETIGRQVGAWGTILAGGHPDPKDPRTAWMWRTRLGVCLVHEIQDFDYQPASQSDLYAALFAFGYGSPECRVFNYWDDPHPVTVSGVDARTLVISRAGAALVVVTDYGEGGTCEIALDTGELGVPGNAAATDLETGESVERTAAGRYRFPLKKHDFKVVKVGA